MPPQKRKRVVFRKIGFVVVVAVNGQYLGNSSSDDGNPQRKPKHSA
jgi:hypothetical protein